MGFGRQQKIGEKMADKIPKGYQGTYAKNSNATSTLVMVTRDVDTTKKGGKTMADKKETKNTSTGSSGGNNGVRKEFTPTFRKYSDMSQGEQEAFKQGATTANNNIKERLGLKKGKDN